MEFKLSGENPSFGKFVSARASFPEPRPLPPEGLRDPAAGVRAVNASQDLPRARELQASDTLAFRVAGGGPLTRPGPHTPAFPDLLLVWLWGDVPEVRSDPKGLFLTLLPPCLQETDSSSQISAEPTF